MQNDLKFSAAGLLSVPCSRKQCWCWGLRSVLSFSSASLGPRHARVQQRRTTVGSLYINIHSFQSVPTESTRFRQAPNRGYTSEQMGRSRNLWKWTVSVLWFEAEPQCRDKTTHSRRAAGFLWQTCPTRRQEGKASCSFTTVLRLKMSPKSMKSVLFRLSPPRSPFRAEPSQPFEGLQDQCPHLRSKMFLPSKKTSATRHCRAEHQADGEKQRFTNILSKKLFKNIPR